MVLESSAFWVYAISCGRVAVGPAYRRRRCRSVALNSCDCQHVARIVLRAVANTHDVVRTAGRFPK
jgi:hypothetical protein